MKKKLMSLGLVPSLVSAQDAGTGATATGCAAIADANTFSVLLCRIGTILNNVIPILITLAVIYFIWGVINYAIAKDESAKTEGRGAMVWGLVALMVIVSVWGLVNFMKDFIGIQDDNEINIPCVSAPGSGIVCPQDED